MKLVLTADATQRDKAGDGGTGIFFGQSFFPPLSGVLPFNGDARSETESAILIVQVRPRRFDSLGIFTAVERFELTAFLALTGTTIRDAEEDAGANRNRMMMRMAQGGRR